MAFPWPATCSRWASHCQGLPNHSGGPCSPTGSNILEGGAVYRGGDAPTHSKIGDGVLINMKVRLNICHGLQSPGPNIESLWGVLEERVGKLFPPPDRAVTWPLFCKRNGSKSVPCRTCIGHSQNKLMLYWLQKETLHQTNTLWCKTRCFSFIVQPMSLAGYVTHLIGLLCAQRLMNGEWTDRDSGITSKRDSQAVPLAMSYAVIQHLLPTRT